jgi:hypothetical protein
LVIIPKKIFINFRKKIMKRILLSIAIALMAGISFSQSVIIFRPGPGLNDGTDEGGLNGGKDSFVYDDQSTTNFGTAVDIATNPISTCNLTNLQAYIKFDVASLPLHVDSVFLWFYNYAYNINCYSNCDNTFDLRYVTSAWDEMTLNWNNRPESGANFSETVRITFPYNGGPIRLNLTSAYLSWKNGSVPNYGFTIYPLDGDCNNACVSFAPASSDEADTIKRPYLEIYTQSSGVQETNGILSQVVTFPNPVKENLNINFFVSKQKELTLTINDFTGKEIETRKVNITSPGTNSLQVNTSVFSSGLYFYRLSSSEGTASGMFVVKRD